MIFTYCAILLAYAVTAFALYQRADSPHIAGPTAGPILSAPQGFALSVSFKYLICLNLASPFAPAQAFFLMEPAALRDQPTTHLIVCSSALSH